MIKAKIVGAGGYGGVGITELLLRHPQAQIACLVDTENVGTPMSGLYPHLTDFCDMKIVAPEDPQALAPADVVFFSTPDGVGQQFARAELAKGAKVIDYSGDFRFNTPESYADYATRIGKAIRENKHWYYLDDGVYGGFSGIVFDHCKYQFKVFKRGETQISTLAGPTCDSLDIIARGEDLPELEIGDIVYVNNVGAYSSASATTFNGIAPAKIVVVP